MIYVVVSLLCFLPVVVCLVFHFRQRAITRRMNEENIGHLHVIKLQIQLMNEQAQKVLDKDK